MANLENETDFEDTVETVAEASEEVVENEVNEEAETVEEDTLASSSLKPAARSVADPKAINASKVAMMQHMVNTMAGMTKKDCTEWFDKAMAVFGPGKDHGVGDKSGSNQASIDTTLGKGPKTKYPMPKLDSKNHWAEDVADMFQGQDLSEEFKDKASTLFEAAVGARITTEIARLEEEFETKLDEQVAIISEEMNSKLDTYLDYVVENWMKENEVAIESTLRNEIMEEFIDGLKGLFAEHYISVPEDKVDVLEALADKVESLEQKLDEAITKNAELEVAITEEARKDIFEEISSDLALTQQEKFAALAEGIEFDGDLDTYTKKLKIVKENYFKASTAPSSNITEETFEGEINENVVSVDPVVSRYVKAISRTVKN